MNENQKKVIITTASFIFLMLIFPPFHYYYPNGVEINLGYSFLLNPPPQFSARGSVHILQLLVQWVGVGVVGGLIYFLLKDPKK